MNMNKRGDTIVEVLLATTVLSAILFSSWAIVNRASQISLAARQRVYMVDQLKEWAEILKSYYAATDGKTAVGEGRFATAYVTPVNAISGIADNPCDVSRNNLTREVNANSPVGSFHFDGSAAATDGYKKGISTYSEAAVWIQRVPVNVDAIPGPEFNDFYIQSCWLSTGGGTQKEDNSKIIVRLNI